MAYLKTSLSVLGVNHSSEIQIRIVQFQYGSKHQEDTKIYILFQILEELRPQQNEIDKFDDLVYICSFFFLNNFL
jgi:hypothetical protein